MITLKELLASLFGNGTKPVSVVVNQGVKPTIDFVSPLKTDRTFVRKLYHNTEKDYLLSAHLVKTIVNNNVNFIGKPVVFDTNKIVEIIKSAKINYAKVHRSTELDGDIFIWPQWDNRTDSLKLIYIPIDVVDKIFIDPETKEVTGYRFAETLYYSTPTQDNCIVDISYVITKDVIIKSMVGTITKVVKARNFLGELPIVHFSNDKEDSELYGHSEIENILPQLKFYHDLTYEAGAAQSRDGHPKLNVTTRSVKQWIDNNFGEGTYENVRTGQQKISLEDRDLFLSSEGDTVNYLYLTKTSGDYATLSEVAFTNIVEGSEVPEINFGANIGTSLASVKEYRPIWIKKIEAKQEEKTESWLKVYDLLIKIYNFVHFTQLKLNAEIVWPKPNFASVKEQAEIVDAFAKAITNLKATKSLTKEEIYNTLRSLDVFILAKTYKLHQKDVDKEVEDDKLNEKDNAQTKKTADE